MLPTDDDIKCQFKANTCYLVVPLGTLAKHKAATGPHEQQQREELALGQQQHVENVRNCDIFIDDYDFYIYADVKLYRFQSKRCFDVKELKSLIIQYDSKECCYKLQLRCLPPEAAHPPKPKNALKEYKQIAQYARAPSIDKDASTTKAELWKLRRITEICLLQLDNAEVPVKFDSNFAYGFARSYSGKLQEEEYDIQTCRVPEPQRKSPLQRTIDRLLDEMKRFSRDIYKVNFVELQVPDGHESPNKYKAKYSDTVLSSSQTQLLHNLTCKPEHKELPNTPCARAEIDCCLISILLAICYDVRCTGNEPTCETGWTRSILSATLCYFEPFDNYKSVVISFMRRALTYPLFRNYELAHSCVQDAIDALNSGRAWLLKQLLITHEYFTESEPSRDVFNVYYIEDYIRYVHNTALFPTEHFRLLARNLKNVLLDVSKSNLDFGINEIESELLKELIDEMHLAIDDTEDEDDMEDDDDDDDDEDDDDDDDDEDDEDDDEDDEMTTEDDEDDDADAVIEEEVIVHNPQELEQNPEQPHSENDGSPLPLSQDTSDSFGGSVDSSDCLLSMHAGLEFDYDDDTSSSETEGNSVIEQCSSEATNK